MTLLKKMTPLAGAVLCALLLPIPAITEEEVHFQDNFESATLGNTPPNSDGWTIVGAGGWHTANMTTVNTQNHTQGGSKAMYSSGGNVGQGIGSWNAPGFGGAGAITNGRAELWFYDDMAATKIHRFCCQNATGSQQCGVLIRTTTSATKYCLNSNILGPTATAIDRTLGWHKQEWVRDNNNTTIYLDGVSVYVIPVASFTDFNDFDCGSFSWDNIAGNTGLWIDDAKVVRGQNQSQYRWYSNTAGVQPETPTALAAVNTAITNVNNGDKLRLRVQVQNDMSYAWTGAYVALRYQEGTTGTWTDLGAAAHWNYADGAGSNGNQVANALFVAAPVTNIREHFVESAPSAGIVSVPATQYAEWDVAISPVWANVTKGGAYYFKVVLVDGSGNYLSDLVSYPRLPQATTLAPKTWDGSASISWNNLNNWTPAGVPGAGDDVVIPNATTTPNDPVLDATTTIQSLSVASAGILNFNNGVAQTLTVSGNATFNGTVTQTTSSIVVNGSAVTIGANYTHNNSGTFTANNATMTINPSVTYTQSGTGSVSLGNLTINGAYSQTTSNNTLGIINLTINNGGAFTNTVLNTASQVNISGTFTNNGTMSSTTGGNFRFSGASSAIAGNSNTTRFWQFTLVSGQTAVSATGSPAFTVLAGGVTLTSGTLSAANQTMAIAAGSWTNNGGTLTGSGSTVIFTLGSGVNIDLGTTPTTFQNVEVAKTAGQNLTASRALNIDGNFTITTGNFVPGAFTHNVAGNWSDAGGSFAPAGGTIILDGSSPAITTAAANNFFNLTVSTNGTGSMGASELDVNGALVISAGATLNCGSSILNDVAATTGITGTLDAGTGTTTLRGAVTVNSGGSLRLLTGAAAPTVKIGNGAVAGSITVNSGGTFFASGSPRPTITWQGSAIYPVTIASGATISIDGLVLDRLDANGLNIANGATITKIDNCSFTNATTRCLSVGANTGSNTFYYCVFDATANPNVYAPNGTTIVMNNASGARGASPNGEANDGVIDANITWTYADKVWTGGTTSWNTAGNWSPAGVPSALQGVAIPVAANQPTFDVPGGSTISSLTLVTGATLSLTGNLTLTISNNATFNGTVSQTLGSVVVNGTTVTIGGAYTQSGAGTFAANNATMTVNSGATYTQSGTGSVTVGNLAISGLYAQSTSDNTLGVTNLTINSGGEFRNTRVTTTSLINIAGIFTNNGTMANTTGGNFRFSGAAGGIAGSSANTTFYRFTLLSGATTVTATGNPVFTALAGGGIVLTSGSLSAANDTIVDQGDWTNAAGSFTGAGSLVRFTGGAAAVIDNGAAQTTFQNVMANKSAGIALTAGQALNIDGSFTIASGNFVPAGFTHTVAGNWNDAGGSFAPAAGTITMDGSSPTVTTAAVNNFFNLTISASGTVSPGAYELDVNGNLTVSAGAALNFGSGTANDVAGTTGISGTLDMGTGTTTLRGAVTVNSGGTLQMVTATSAPIVKLGGAAAGGTITLSSGGTFTASGSPRPTLTRTGSVSHAFTVLSGSTMDINGLNIDYPDANGLSIANGATITRIDNCYFTNGTKYLSVGANSGTYTFNFCSFDGTANPNVTAPNGAIIIMGNATGARGAPNATAELWDGPVDAAITWSYAKVWTGGAGTTNWATAGNWSPANQPTSAEDVLISDQTFDPALTALSSVRAVIITNGVLSLGANTLQVYGDVTIQAIGTLTAGTGTVSMMSGATQAIDAANKTFYNLTATGNSTVTLNSTSSVSNALQIDAGSSIAVASGKTLTLSSAAAQSSLNGTLELTANSILKAGGDITVAGTFKISGTSLNPGGYATVQNNGSGNYTLTLAGNTIVNYGHINDLKNAGLVLSGNGGASRCFSNILFYDGQSSTTIYLHVTNAGWNGYTFSGLGFEETHAGIRSVEINSGGSAITMSGYQSGTGWTSGASSDLETAGTITWVGSQPAPVWSLSSMGQINGLAIGQSVAYVGTGASTNALYSINAADGSTKWSYSTSSYGGCNQPTYIYSIAAGSKYRVFASAGNYIIGRQDNGTSSAQIFAPVNLGAAAGNPYAGPDDNTLYVSYGNKVGKYTISTGASVGGLWPVTLASGNASADLVVFNDEVYVGSTTGFVRKYDADGTPNGSFNAGASVDQPLWSDGALLYVTPASSNVYAVNASTMAQIWQTDVGATHTGPAFMAFNYGSKTGLLYAAAGTNALEVTDAGVSGSVTHTYAAGTTVNSGPIPFGSVVYAGLSNGTYHAFNITTQAEVTNWPYYGATGNASAGPVIFQPSAGDTLVIFGSTGGNLDAFRRE